MLESPIRGPQDYGQLQYKLHERRGVKRSSARYQSVPPERLGAREDRVTNSECRSTGKVGKASNILGQVGEKTGSLRS